MVGLRMEIGWRRRRKKRSFSWLSSQNAGNNCDTEQSCHQPKNVNDDLYNLGYGHRPSQEDRADSVERARAKKYHEFRDHPCTHSQETPFQRASVSLASEASHHLWYTIEDKIQLKYEHRTLRSDACLFLTSEKSAQLAAA